MILFVGDTGSQTAKAALDYSPAATLIDHYNYQQINSCCVAYTSLGDLPNDLSAIYKLFDQAEQLIYVPVDGTWSDGKQLDPDCPTASMQGLTEFILTIFDQEKGNVKNLNHQAYTVDHYTTLVDSRRTNQPQLWIAGCSTSHATGVSDSERYGQRIADTLGMPVSFLTCPGSSISWAADQILRSDIRADDIVIWGLTDESRFSLWGDNKLIHVHANYDPEQVTSLSKNIVDRLLIDQTNFYQAVTHVYQVSNFCKKIQAKLLILGLNASDVLSLHLSNLKEFIKFVNKISNTRYIDLGTDHRHPGPQQHSAFAELCIKKLKSLNYIQ